MSQPLFPVVEVPDFISEERLNYLGESVTVFIVCHSHG